MISLLFPVSFNSAVPTLLLRLTASIPLLGLSSLSLFKQLATIAGSGSLGVRGLYLKSSTCDQSYVLI